MLQERNLIYFDPFYFPNGKSTAKSKYFIVLKVDSDEVILGALPTRKDVLPSQFDSVSGCIQMSEPGNTWTCYRILPHETILENEKCPFDKITHIYASNIEDYSLKYFEIYPTKGVDYTILGAIKQDVFEELILCFTNSTAVKRKYKKRLIIEDFINLKSSPKAN